MRSGRRRRTAAKDNGWLVPLTPLAAAYDHLLLDLDGCVWVGEDATPRAGEAIAAARRSGHGIAFVTNDARHTEEGLVRKLWSVGVQASAEEVVSAAAAVQHLLAERYPGGATAFVIGAQALVDHVAYAGLRVLNGTDLAPRAEVVVVASHDLHDYRELTVATQAVLRGATLIGTCRDPTFPGPDGMLPGTGAILAAIETATGALAEIAGKPEPPIYRTALDRLGPGRGLVIGDRIEADLVGAHASGLDGALVLSGVSTREQAAAADPPPVAVAATLADLILR